MRSFLRFVLGVAFRAACVYYCWVNSKAIAEGRECNSFLCYEVVKAAACMVYCPPSTLVKVCLSDAGGTKTRASAVCPAASSIGT